MTDQNFTAEQREIIETMFHHASVGEFLEGMSHYVRDLKNLRPNPPHPTLADMTEEWGVSLPDGQLVGAGWGTYDTALEDMNAWRRDGYDARIVRRYVTEPEEIS